MGGKGKRGIMGDDDGYGGVLLVRTPGQGTTHAAQRRLGLKAADDDVHVGGADGGATTTACRQTGILSRNGEMTTKRGDKKRPTARQKRL